MNKASADQVQQIRSLSAEVTELLPSWAADCARYAEAAEDMLTATATVVIDNLRAARRNARKNAR
jgi:hypothetical protein